MDRINLTEAQMAQMNEHVQATAPNEACGLLGGIDAIVHHVVPITNTARSPIRYRMDPGQQIEALFGFEAQNLELTGIFHSHPGGPPGPSQTDLDEAAYPEAVQLIWFQSEAQWTCRAFRFEDGGAVEVELKVQSEGSGENQHSG